MLSMTKPKKHILLSNLKSEAENAKRQKCECVTTFEKLNLCQSGIFSPVFWSFLNTYEIDERKCVACSLGLQSDIWSKDVNGDGEQWEEFLMRMNGDPWYCCILIFMDLKLKFKVFVKSNPICDAFCIIPLMYGHIYCTSRSLFISTAEGNRPPNEADLYYRQDLISNFLCLISRFDLIMLIQAQHFL